MFSPLRAVLLASAQYRAARASWSARCAVVSGGAFSRGFRFPESAASSRTVTVELLRYCISNPFPPTPVLEHPGPRGEGSKGERVREASPDGRTDLALLLTAAVPRQREKSARILS